MGLPEWVFLLIKTDMERRIIDKRKKEKYMMDDEYLNGQAKLCGWQGTIVYTSLCRHANVNQESFPSIKLMAEQHGVSRPTIMKGIENLENRKVIEVKKTRTNDGKWLNNTYILLDKSEWDYSQVNGIDMDSQVNVETTPSQRGLHDQVNVVDTKETHTKETHKEGNTSSKTSVLQISEVIKLFEEVNPSYEKLFGNTTQRSACERLLKKWTISQIKAVVGILPEINRTQYARGKSITPLQLEDNLGHIKAYIEQKKSTSKTLNLDEL